MADRNGAVPPTSASTPERGRWSSRRKLEVVLRVLRGEDLTLVGPLEWVAVFCDAAVAVARTRGWEIGGGAREPGSVHVNVSGRYVALPTT